MKKFILCFIATVCIIAASEIDMHGKMGPAPLASSQLSAAKNKILVQNFWNAVFNEHKISVIDEVVDEKYIQHNPYFKDGRSAFKDGISGFFKEFPNSSAEIKHIGADGDLVFIHNHIKLNADDRGQAAMDIFRLKNGKIVEHWDIIQDIPEKSQNNNTMF
ncbi:nuclear transport factor 2 family protein [Campylobacter hyointestinalis]|uniref:nuclear transport factor 2 family protein n=1 Tax=Campylobacter hyointestinalis TaxID=198 RepID=UPI001C67F0A8|nr:ester cyclase [Campylobacter hyointestinalis]